MKKLVLVSNCMRGKRKIGKPNVKEVEYVFLDIPGGPSLSAALQGLHVMERNGDFVTEWQTQMHSVEGGGEGTHRPQLPSKYQPELHIHQPQLHTKHPKSMHQPQLPLYISRSSPASMPMYRSATKLTQRT